MSRRFTPTITVGGVSYPQAERTLVAVPVVPVVPSITLTGLSPSQGPIGSTIMVTGTGFVAGLAVNFTGAASAVALNIEPNGARVIVPSGATSGPVTVTTLSGTSNAQTFTVGALLPTDSFAILPRREPRWSATPPSRDGVPLGRVFRLASGFTDAQFRTAMDDASVAASAGSAFVLIPDGTDFEPPHTTTSYQPPRPVSPAFPVVLCSAAWFDGTVTYSTGATLTAVQSAAQPVLRSRRINNAAASDADPLITWVGTQDLVIVGLRFLDNTSGAHYCRSTLTIGDSTNAALSGDNIGHVALWWTSAGLTTDANGKAFRPDGTWRAGMGRCVNVNGSGFAWRNSRGLGHGAPAELGSDRGAFGGWTSTGPWMVRGNDFQNPGGIAFMHGGANSRPGMQLEDVTIDQNRFYRTNERNRFHPSARDLDINAVACPYTAKNIGEIKTGDYWLIERNLMLNDYAR
jgi:hypothetical protein